jgi:hypothetical protein
MQPPEGALHVNRTVEQYVLLERNGPGSDEVPTL